MQDQIILTFKRPFMVTDHAYTSDQNQMGECSSALQVYLVEKRSLKYLNNGVTDYVRQLKRQKRHPV